MYKLLRPILFTIQPETMHNAVAALGRNFSGLSEVFSPLFRYEHPSLETEVFGVRFKNPIGLAPGYEKSGGFARFMAALGFGFIEVGTVTPEPQPGNPKPRLFRLDADKAIINRMGFNSMGAMAVAKNLKRLEKRDFVIGVNLGKNKITPNEEALRDYATGFTELAPLADYVVVNVSSPNTPGLRELQGKEELRNLLMELQKLNPPSPALPLEGREIQTNSSPLRGPASSERRRGEEVRWGWRPLLLKISPDLTDGELDDIAEIVLETKIDGVIATNTAATEGMGGGGLSGRPIAKRVTEVIGYLYKKLEGRVPIIGAGGIFSAEDAYEKIRAGASLVEIYTGMIYEGPSLPKKIKRGLVKLLEADGFRSVKEVVGANHRLAPLEIHDNQ